jgi:tetratricopeptide (TPR) repeat protein
MSPDSSDHIKQSEREKFLEEIRRRAEEAELKRLEADEPEGDDVPAPGPPAPSPVHPPPASAPPSIPSPPSDASSLPPKAVREQKILVLRERLSIALDRGRVDKAAELLEELKTLVPDSPDLQLLGDRLEAAREDQARARDKRRSVSSLRPQKESAVVRERKAADKKKIVQLLESAASDYQQEKYEKALGTVEELLSVDPDNDEAQQLKQQIQKAQRIAELVKKEEARTRAEQASLRPAPREPEQVQDRTGDPWGASTAPQAQDDGLELPPEEAGPVGPPKPPVMDRVVSRVARIRVPVKPLLWILIVAAATVLLYFVVDNIRNAVIPPNYSVLVYPATPVSGDSTVGWTADGLTDDLIRDLSAISELRVFGPGTTFAFRGSQRDVLRTARGLGANFALQLGVARSGYRVALQSALYDTLLGKSIWSSRIETTLKDLPAARQDLARKVIALMEVSPSPEEESVIRRFATTVEGSYDAYMLGRSMMRQPQLYPPGTLLPVLTQAVVADSFFADGQSALGWAYVLAYEADDDAPLAYLENARMRVQRAASLAPRNAEAFLTWGVIELYRSQREKSVERLEQAVALAPSDAEARRRLAIASVAVGQTDAALKAASRAIANDPGTLSSYTVLALVQQFAGDNRTAGQTYEEGLRLAPDKSAYASAGLADVMVFTQQPDRAIAYLLDRLARARESYIDFYKLGRVQQSAGKAKAEWTEALNRALALVNEKLDAAPDDADALSWKALILTRLGAFREALAAGKRAVELGPDDPVVLYNLARMYALQRDKTRAFEGLSKAVTRRYDLERIMDMDFFNLRVEEDFRSIVSR